MKQTPSSILFCRQDRLGDLVLSLPLAAAVKDVHPDCKIGFLVAEPFANLVKMCKEVDEVWPANLATKLDKQKLKDWDAVVVLFPDASLARQLFFAGVKRRIGTSRRGYSIFFNERINLHRAASNRHETDLNFDLLNAVIHVNRKCRPSFVVPHSSYQLITALLSEKGIGKDQKIAVIHPGSGGSSRDWPIELFAKVADVLQKRNDTSVVVTGSDQETKLAREVMGKYPSKIFNLAGETTIEALTALLSVSGLCIANSTGPLHLANALNVPSVGLFPPLENCGPERWGVLDHPERSLTPSFPDENCPFCTNYECESGECMSLLSVEKVLEIAEPLLLSECNWFEKFTRRCAG